MPDDEATDSRCELSPAWQSLRGCQQGNGLSFGLGEFQVETLTQKVGKKVSQALASTPRDQTKSQNRFP